MAQFFDNRTIIAPSTEVAIDDSQIGPASTAAQQVNVGLIGESTLGTPDQPYLITSVDQAVARFGQGKLVDGIKRALNPVADGGAQQVYGIRVNSATPGELDLLDSNTDVAVHLFTRDFGSYTRGLRVKVEAATHAGAGNVPEGALKVTTASNLTLLSGDDLGYNVLLVEALINLGTVSIGKWTGSIVGSYDAGDVTGFGVSSGGSGYLSAPAVALSAPQTPGGVQATATAHLTGDAVTSITVGTAGSGYTSPPTVTITGGSGAGAVATATIDNPATSLTVTTSEAGQSPAQLVGQQITIVGSLGTSFTTHVQSVSGSVVTLTVGDPFPRSGNVVTGVQTALLLDSTAVQDQAGLPLSSFGSLNALAQAATAVGTNWLVTVPGPSTTPTRMNSSPSAVTNPAGTSNPNILDLGQIFSVNPGEQKVLTGLAQAVTDWLNGTGQPYFYATRGTDQSGLVPAPTTGYRYAAGGADDATGGSVLAGTLTVTSDDWDNALRALATIDTPIFVLLSGDPAIIKKGDDHAVTMSTTGRMERIQLCGLELANSTNTPVDDLHPSAVGESLALNSFRSYLLYPGIYDFDSDGNQVDLPGYYGAAQAAGLAAGLGENVALTGKVLRVQGLEHRSLNNGGAFGPDDVNLCLQAGVMPLVFRPGRGFVIVQSISTWQDDIRYSKREMSVRRIVDRLARSIRERLDIRIGDGVTPDFLAACLRDTRSVLETFVQRQYIVGDSTNPPYVGLKASVEQGRPDTVLISFQASPVIPANYILVTAHLTTFGN